MADITALLTNAGNDIVITQTTAFPSGVSLDDWNDIYLNNYQDTLSFVSPISWMETGTALGSQTVTPSDFSLSTIPDGVYYLYLDGLVGTDSITYNNPATSTYLLRTTIIDVGIVAYSVTDAFTKANKLRMQKLRADIDTFFAEADYASCDDYIGQIENMLVITQTDFITTLSLTNRRTLFVNMPEQGITDVLRQQINLTWNSLLSDSVGSEVVESTFGESGSGSASFDSADIYNLSYYQDGVQWWFTYFQALDACYGSNALALITTTIDAQWVTFQEYYDPTDATQLSIYNAVKLLFAEIDDLKGDLPTNFTQINLDIEQIQEYFAMFINPTIRVTLPSKDNILVEITSEIPNVTYTSQKLVLSNCGDDTQEYTLENSFPANYVDVSKTLNSETILFGSQYADSVYQANVSWNTDNSMSFSGQGYVLVTTQIDCGIAKIIAQHPTCKVLISKLNEIMTYRRIITESFNNGDYTTTIFYIKLCLTLLTKSGCNCGC